MQIVLQCNEKLRICLDDREVSDAALGLLDMYKRLLRTGIIFKVLYISAVYYESIVAQRLRESLLCPGVVQPVEFRLALCPG